MAPPAESNARLVGPYILQELVDDLPLDTPVHQNVTVTCLESWGTNLYVGTSAHEILHLVSIPSTPNPASPKPVYILASRLHPHSVSNPAAAAGSPPFIKQIVVLPSVSKALVLSSTGQLTFYTLPEFSPAFNGTKVKDVSYVGGLDQNEEEEMPGDDLGDGKPKLVMALAKQRIRMIRVGEELRLVKDIPLPNTLAAARRNNIACVATDLNYNLLDVDNIQRIPLFPISATEEQPEPPEPPAAAPLAAPPAAPLAESSGSATHSDGGQSLLHPPRSSSLTSRERRNSSATTVARESSTAATSHNRSVSAGNLSGRSPTRSSKGGRQRHASRMNQSHLTPPDSGTPRSGSPASSTADASQQSPPEPPATGSRVPSPAPAPAQQQQQQQQQPPPPPPPSKSPKPPPPSKSPKHPPPSKSPKPPQPIVPLRPHIASPSQGEFLLTTGTRPEDPGVAMFVNLDGDVTRGTIQFEKYPAQLIVQGGWVIAVIPGKGLDIQRWDLEDEGAVDEVDKHGSIPMEGEIHLKEVLGLEGTFVAGAGRTLRLVRVPLKVGDPDESVGDKKRNDEEQVIAQRISTVQSRAVVFSGHRVWTLLPSPLSVRLDSRLPEFSHLNFDGYVARVRRVLHVLDEVQSIEPDSETSFHEVSFVRQKCGLLVLGELLRITQKQTADIAADEIMRAEMALLESALDPRFIVALFGTEFEQEVVEADGGVWVYGGIKEVFVRLKQSKDVGNAFTRDALLLLKRFLAVWRGKKGFGSVADEKEVFLTVDAAMLRVLLMLDSPQYLTDKGNTVVQEGNVRAELYSFIDGGVEDFNGAVRILEAFGRLYVLSILYSRAKMFRNVLNTWRRIVEGADGDARDEFKDGEERVKNYLLKMKDPELVEEFGCWLAGRNPRLGIQVFASEEAKVKFDPSKVLEMLRAHSPDAVRPYVEYLVLEKKNSAYSNDLIHLYLDDLTHTLSSDPLASETLQSSYESYRALAAPKPTYHEFIVENSPTDGHAPWWHSRMRLLELLGGASGYDVPQVFERIQQHRDELVPEMVILYGRGSKHADALKLLTHHLRDFDTAINYCLFGGLSIYQTRSVITDPAEQSELFAILLDEYLKLEDVSERIEQTARLLEKFGRWLDVTHVLAVVPDEWSIEILGGFLISALRRLVREKAEVRVERALGRSRSLRVEAQYVQQCDEIGPVVDMGH